MQSCYDMQTNTLYHLHVIKQSSLMIRHLKIHVKWNFLTINIYVIKFHHYIQEKDQPVVYIICTETQGQKFYITIFMAHSYLVLLNYYVLSSKLKCF